MELMVETTKQDVSKEDQMFIYMCFCDQEEIAAWLDCFDELSLMEEEECILEEFIHELDSSYSLLASFTIVYEIDVLETVWIELLVELLVDLNEGSVLFVSKLSFEIDA